MPIGINLYAPNANVYRKPDGTPWPLARDKGEMLVTVEDFTRREVVVVEYGGQFRRRSMICSLIANAP
jgi:hypothetical protein